MALANKVFPLLHGYDDFLSRKKLKSIFKGIELNGRLLNPNLFPFQEFIVRRALQTGRHAIFADCGTGKTICQLEWARVIVEETNKPVLILCPLAVAGQTIKEGKKFGIEVKKFDFQKKSSGIRITNYDQIANVAQFAKDFVGIVLDESSILKNFTGKIRNAIIEMFSNTAYKLFCTATPSPNDEMEMGNHAEGLNVMSRNEMLSMFFVHDGGNTSKWRLKKHSVDDFYSFISEWATMLSKPSDIGFEQEGFDLPKLNFIERQIETELRSNALINDVAVSATNFNKELRMTQDARIQAVCDIVNNSKENFIVWVKHNDESERLAREIKDAVEVKGSHSSEYKEEKLYGFAQNEFRVLITKSKIAQFGLNYQNCHNQVFMSLDFSFESLYQSIRRSYRFGQKHPVNIYLITTDTMLNVKKAIEEKSRKFQKMQNKMSEAISKKVVKKQDRIQPVTSCADISIGKNYKLINGDCVQEIKALESNSAHFSVFSPPFADLYVYSDMMEDMGNAKDYKEFFDHFRFLIPELLRITMPGRLVAVHCADLPIQKAKEGYIGLRDFSGLLVQAFSDFIYHSRITIWKNPVTEMQRTKALGLLHKQIRKDSSMCRVGNPDYVLLFRKPGDNPVPIDNSWMPVSTWQEWASPVWMNINQSNTLQFKSAREQEDERHICPLQLEVIERLIQLYSNEGETVFSPFAGIGSEGYQALQMKRKFIGIELKKSYFDLATHNLSGIEESIKMSGSSLLDMV